MTLGTGDENVCQRNWYDPAFVPLSDKASDQLLCGCASAFAVPHALTHPENITQEDLQILAQSQLQPSGYSSTGISLEKLLPPHEQSSPSRDGTRSFRESLPSVPSSAFHLCHVHVPKLVGCAEHGDERTVAELLDSGEDPNTADDMGLTALHCASKKGHETVVELLLIRGADPNVSALACQSRTPLHYACKYGHLDVVQLLLAYGAYPDVLSEENKTPMQHAKEKANRSVEAALQHAISAKAELHNASDSAPGTLECRKSV
jgi:hypothetical protein